MVDGRVIPDKHLRPRQDELLHYLALNAGRVCSDDELIETVEYVIDNPRLARRLVEEVKNHSSFKSRSHRVEETPVYPDTAEQKPYLETPVYPDT